MPRRPRRCRQCTPSPSSLSLALSVIASFTSLAAAATSPTSFVPRAAGPSAAAQPHAQPYPRNLHRAYDGTWEIVGGSGAAPFSEVPLVRPRFAGEGVGSNSGESTGNRRVDGAGDGGLRLNVSRPAWNEAVDGPKPQAAVSGGGNSGAGNTQDVASGSGQRNSGTDGRKDSSASGTGEDATGYTSELAFDNRAGFALLTAVNHESALGEDINIVFGELLIRDGPYRSAHDVSLRLMGVYQWASGKLVVVGDVLYEDTVSALQRLFKVFAGNQAPGDLDALAKRNVTEETFVSALSPAFAKHRKQFHSPRSQMGASPTSQASSNPAGPSGLSSVARRPSVAAQCPFSATISIVAGSFSDRLPTRPDLSSLGSFDSGPGALDGASGAGGQEGSLKGNAGRQLSAAAAVTSSSSGENISTFEEGSIDGQSELVEMNGVYKSDACKTQLNIVLSTLDTEMLFGKAINYTLLVTFVAFLQVVVLIRQMEMTSTQAGASRVSLMTVGLQAVADSYLCLGHLTMGIAVPTLFNAFATAAFFKFIIFSIFEMRYLLLIWKARRPSGFAEGWEAMRRELSLLYSRFYGSLLLGIVILYQLQNHLKYFLFALMAFWVPQIVLNVVGDHRKPLHPVYIFGMSATRLMIPLYFYACPRNFLHVQPQYWTAAALVAWVVLQAAVLLSQHRYGSRWFVPRPLLPVKYDYFRRVSHEDAVCGGAGVAGGVSGDVEEGEGDGEVDADESAALAAEEGRTLLPGTVECVICMTPVAVDGSDRMVTPCNHFFHTECLCSWLEVKLECAVCRRPVPPP